MGQRKTCPHFLDTLLFHAMNRQILSKQTVTGRNKFDLLIFQLVMKDSQSRWERQVNHHVFSSKTVSLASKRSVNWTSFWSFVSAQCVLCALWKAHDDVLCPDSQALPQFIVWINLPWDALLWWIWKNQSAFYFMSVHSKVILNILMLWCMFDVFQCCFVLYVLCVYCAHFHSLHERPSCQKGILFTPPVSFSLRVGLDFKWVLPVADILMLWCIYVVLLRKKAAPHNNRIRFVLFVCVLCTMWCFVWFLHEMVLLQHEN